MDKRELDNFLVSRGVGEPDCPICGHNEWGHVTFADGYNLLITGEDPDGEQIRGIRVMATACLQCAFIRLHSQNVIAEYGLNVVEETFEDGDEDQ